ncbi:MAG TPA: 30S ribosomal protein S1 [Candidatus Limnocylindrales bacterium]|nr:30S ribosomal protein S1 [Candidatus Limnocylindrales bacterium]
MTDEKQSGTEPQPEAIASEASPASEERVAAVAVADEPAAAPEPATAPDDTITPGGESDETVGSSVEPVADVPEPADAEPAEPSEPAESVAADIEAPAPAEPVGQEADAPADASDDAPAEPPVAVPPAAAAVPSVVVEPSPMSELTAADMDDAPTAADEPPAPPRDLGPEPTTMEELLAEQDSDIKSFKHGDVVEGTVVRIDKDEILVDIGAKSEGVVSNRELYGRHAEAQPQLGIGDTVLVYVLQPESQEGHVVLSLRRAGLERKWRAMQEQFEAGVIIEAPVIDHNKGGLIVDCGIRGFVPISQIVDFPRRPQNDQPRDAAQEIAEKLQPFVGRKLRLKILEVNRKANRLILSEKVALYEERREKRDELFSSLQVSQKVTGTVRSIAPFGVFIDLGGIDGLVHKSELSWNKVNNPEAGYKVGDEVEAEVIDINHERGRISLSIRRLQPDPWHSTVADFKVGDIIDGTVTKLVNFGAFVRVRDGLEGLIHISELSHQRVAHPGDVVHEGQNLKLKIISLDSERHRLGLSLKQAEEPPARPAPEPGTPRPERRPRPERGYSMADAVQEPEGGIDNTLAAAFAQVREQVAASEEARAAAAEPEPEAEVAVAAELEPEAVVAEPEPEAAAAEPEPELETVAAEPEPEGAVAVAAETEPEATAAEPEATAAEPEVVAAEPELEAVAVEPEPEAEAAVAAEPEAETAAAPDEADKPAS